MAIRILSGADVRAAISMREAIEAVREGFIALSEGRAHAPQRPNLHTGAGDILFMPAYVEGGAYGVVKAVSVFPQNPARGLPTVSAAVVVFDLETGQPVALLDGTYLTALRTGAASGLAADYLARKDAATLGVIGAGAQARTQIDGVCAVRPIRQIRVYARAGAEPLVAEFRTRYPDIRIDVAEDPHAALAGADVLVAATTSAAPVIEGIDVRPGVTVIGVGSYTPQMQEIASVVMGRAKIVVDSRSASLVEAGDLLTPIRDGVITEQSIHAELGEIAAGRKSGRSTPDEITVFKSVGIAVQDVVVAAKIVVLAQAKNLGTTAAL